MQSNSVSILGVLAIILAQFSIARAQVLISRHGSTNPTTQGFSTFSSGASSITGPIFNDLGHDAWFIEGTARSAQFAYSSGPLSTVEKTDISNQGFVLTVQARVLQNMAPDYDGFNHVVVGGVNLDTGARRFEIGLGVNGNGDTVAVLADSVDNSGPGGSIREPGPSFTLAGSGSSYHIYQLVLNAATQSATLFVDGVRRIQAYAGHTSSVRDTGLSWGAISGGQAIFDLVQVISPGSIIQDLGDLNGDQLLNNLDIDDFALALTDRQEFIAQHPNVVADLIGDINGDEILDNLDIDPFVGMLIGNTATVPEPSPFLLMVTALVCVCLLGSTERSMHCLSQGNSFVEHEEKSQDGYYNNRRLRHG